MSFLTSDEEECTGACQDMLSLRILTRDLYYVDLVDITVCILSTFFVLMSWIADFIQCRGERVRKIVNACLYLTFLIDMALQVMALYLAWFAAGIVNMIVEAECLQYGQREAGCEGHAMLIHLQSNLWEILVGDGLGFGASVYQVVISIIICRSSSSVVPISEQVQHRMTAEQDTPRILLALWSAALSSNVFALATRPLKAESDKLFARVGNDEWWCTTGDVVFTTTP